MATTIYVESGFPKIAHEARILAMDAAGNYTSAEVEYIVQFSRVVVDGHTYVGPAIDAVSGLEERSLSEVRTMAKATTIGSLTLKSVAIKERLAPNAFSVTASYTEKDESESGSGSGGGGGSDNESEPQMSFECSSMQKHVTVANKQGVVWTNDAAKYPLGETLGNRIGWNAKYGDDFACEGCDTPTGVATETWTKKMSYSRISTAKKIKWGDMVGKVNNAAWKGWPPRCAMFLGASFSKETGSNQVAVSFHFAVGGQYEVVQLEGKNLTVKKSPFDYIWALSKEAQGKSASDPNAVALPSTVAIVVAEVAQSANFNELGI